MKKQDLIILFLLLLIIFIIFRRHISNFDSTATVFGLESTMNPTGTVTVYSGPMASSHTNMSYGQIAAVNNTPGQTDFIIESNWEWFYMSALDPLGSVPVNIDSTTTQTMSYGDILAWNTIPGQTDLIIPYLDNNSQSFGRMSYLAQSAVVASTTSSAGGGGGYVAALENAAAANAVAENQAWAIYPASYRVMYKYYDWSFDMQGGAISSWILDAMIAQMSGLSSVNNINNIIDIFNLAGAFNPPGKVPFTHYWTDAEITTMFDTAEANGEAGLYPRDQLILRAFNTFSFEIFRYLFKAHNANPTLVPKYVATSDGKCPWADAIFAQTGESVNENMINSLKILRKPETTPFWTGGGGVDYTTMAAAVNSILPPGMTPMDPTQYFRVHASLIEVPVNEEDPQVTTFIWYLKYISTGPMYIWWLANYKWNLDLTNSPYSASNGMWYIRTGPATIPDPLTQQVPDETSTSGSGDVDTSTSGSGPDVFGSTSGSGITDVSSSLDTSTSGSGDVVGSGSGSGIGSFWDTSTSGSDVSGSASGSGIADVSSSLDTSTSG